jgi:hypothetical protein
MAANDHQIGGDHYKKYGMFQPWDCYVVRYRDKDGLKDLYKARHFLNKLIEYEEAQVAAIPTLTEKAP